MPELLEEVLTEIRPVPDPDWAREMDQRVARGFTEERPPRRRRAWRPVLMPAMGALTCVVLLAGIVSLAGTSSDDAETPTGLAESVNSDGGGSTGAASGAAEPAPAGEALLDTARSGDESAAGQAPPLSRDAVPGSNRKVERFASLTLTAPPKDVAKVSDGVLRVTDRLGGYVASSSVSSSKDAGNGVFELKIPVGRLDRAMAELSKLAHVSERSQATQDVTGAYNTARGRLREARTERESLLRQLARADTPNETESIRGRLRIVNAQIGAAKDEVARVNRRTAYATVTVTLVADRNAPGGGQDDDGTWTPGDAWKDAGRILEVAAGVALIALALSIPIGLIGLLAWLGVRWTVRRRRERALDAT